MKLGLPAKLAIFLLMASPFSYSQINDPFCSVWQGETLYTPYTSLDRACASLPSDKGTQCYMEKSVVTNCIESTSQPSENYCFPMTVTSESCSSPDLAATVNKPTDPDNPSDPDNPTDPEDPNPTDPDDPSNPLPDDLSEIRQPRQYTGADADNFSNAQYFSENSLFAASNTILRNQNGIHGSLINRLANNEQKISDSLSLTRASVNSAFGSLSMSLTNLESSNNTLHKITHDNQAQEMQTLQQIDQTLTSANGINQYNKSMIDNIWSVIGVSAGGGCGGFDCPPSYTLAQMLQINQQQLLDALANSDGGGSGGDGGNQSQLLGFIEENTYSSSRTLKDIEDLLESIDEKTVDGSGGGGSSGDLSQTNEKLDTSNQRLNDINNTLATNAQGLSMQLGQQLYAIQSAIENSSGGGSGDGGSGQGDTVAHQKLDGLGEKLDGIKGTLDGFADTSGFAKDLADGTAQGKSDLNQLLDGYDADKMLTDRFKAITDEAEKTMKDSGLSKFSDPSKFIQDSGLVKPNDFDDLVTFAQRQTCSPYSITIHDKSYQVNLCRYANQSSTFLNYVFAVLTAIFCFVMISQTLINERLS